MNEAMRDQAVTYLLGELDAAERAEFERLLAADPGLRDEVDRLAPVAGRLAAAPPEVWEALEPPPLGPLMDAAAAAPPPATESDRGWREWLVPRRLAVAGAAALAIFAGGLVVGSQLLDGSDQSGDPVVAQAELRPLTGGGEGAATVSLASDDSGTAEVTVEGLPPSEPGTYYELWLLGEGEIVSLGSFSVGADGTAEATISIPFDPALYDSFDISVEQEDGDPSHSGDSVLRGPTATT